MLIDISDTVILTFLNNLSIYAIFSTISYFGYLLFSTIINTHCPFYYTDQQNSDLLWDDEDDDEDDEDDDEDEDEDDDEDDEDDDVDDVYYYIADDDNDTDEESEKVDNDVFNIPDKYTSTIDRICFKFLTCGDLIMDCFQIKKKMLLDNKNLNNISNLIKQIPKLFYPGKDHKESINDVIMFGHQIILYIVGYEKYVDIYSNTCDCTELVDLIRETLTPIIDQMLANNGTLAPNNNTFTSAELLDLIRNASDNASGNAPSNAPSNVSGNEPDNEPNNDVQSYIVESCNQIINDMVNNRLSEENNDNIDYEQELEDILSRSANRYAQTEYNTIFRVLGMDENNSNFDASHYDVDE
jgi:hypothetical protein